MLIDICIETLGGFASGVQKDGDNVALEETVPENQKSFLILSRWLHCKAWRTAGILQRQLCHKTQHVCL